MAGLKGAVSVTGLKAAGLSSRVMAEKLTGRDVPECYRSEKMVQEPEGSPCRVPQGDQEA